MRNKLKVGDTVYQGADIDSIRELTVERVGRKFFYVDRMATYDAKYDLTTMKLVTQYGHKPQCYTSRQELEEVFELEKLCGKLRNLFQSYGRSQYSLEQLRRVMAILKENETA